MSLKNPTNDAFIKMYKDWAESKNLPNADKVVTNDPMEATYVGIHMWKQAVEKAEDHRRRQGDRGDGRPDLQGAVAASTLKMDETNHHLHKPVFIGEVQCRRPVQRRVEDQGPGARAAVEPVHPGQRGQAEGSEPAQRRERGVGLSRARSSPHALAAGAVRQCRTDGQRARAFARRARPAAPARPGRDSACGATASALPARPSLTWPATTRTRSLGAGGRDRRQRRSERGACPRGLADGRLFMSASRRCSSQDGKALRVEDALGRPAPASDAIIINNRMRGDTRRRAARAAALPARLRGAGWRPRRNCATSADEAQRRRADPRARQGKLDPKVARTRRDCPGAHRTAVARRGQAQRRGAHARGAATIRRSRAYWPNGCATRPNRDASRRRSAPRSATSIGASPLPRSSAGSSPASRSAASCCWPRSAWPSPTA